MASKKRIEEALQQRLKSDSPEQLEKAGKSWKALPLGFFYVSSEDAVDIAVVETLVGVLKDDGMVLKKVVISNLVAAVSLTSKVKAAVASMWLANLSATEAD